LSVGQGKGCSCLVHSGWSSRFCCWIRGASYRVQQWNGHQPHVDYGDFVWLIFLLHTLSRGRTAVGVENGRRRKSFSQGNVQNLLVLTSWFLF
jgi:hypothetical protein